MMSAKWFCLASCLMMAIWARGGADILLEAESFETKGGWSLDSQFMDQMGSPYLLAHGMGKPVADAVTRVSAAAGAHRLYVRTRNWTAHWSTHPAGTFKVRVNGQELSSTLGTGSAAWCWVDVGSVTLKDGANEIALHDLTGFDGRCDALVFAAQARADAELEALRAQAKAAKPTQRRSFDFVVVGGGVAGICAAVTAARQGMKVALVQDRPILGGNNSSEVRVHLGAYQNLPPYPRLGDVLAEIAPPGPAGNAAPKERYADERKMAVVKAERNLSLFLNTRVNQVEKSSDGALAAVVGEDTCTGARTVFAASLFADTTGDGTVGFLAGADYRMGREGRDEYGEPWAPEKADKMTMGASVQWYARKEASTSAFPVEPWMLSFDEKSAKPGMKGDWNWENGLNRDQIAEAERIRDYGLLVAYSNWSYLKNAHSRKGQFADCSLAWVAYVAGRRETRRLLGDFVLTENHLMNREVQKDGTCATTWTIDQHFPAYSNQTHFAGEPFQANSLNHRIWPYPVPYRCFYSRNVPNLFMAGRDISVSHVALGTTRLMRTHGVMGEVVGMAAAVCQARACRPRAVYAEHFADLVAKMEKGAGDGRAHPPQLYNCQSSLDKDIRQKVDPPGRVAIPVEQSKLFEPFADPESGVVSYLLKPGLVAYHQQSLYYNAKSLTDDGRFLVFDICTVTNEWADPKAGDKKEFAVIDFAQDKVIPLGREGGESHQIPFLDVQKDRLYYVNRATETFCRRDLLVDPLKEVPMCPMPKALLTLGHHVRGWFTHLSMSHDRTLAFLETRISMNDTKNLPPEQRKSRYIQGTLNVITGEWRQWTDTDFPGNHALIHPFRDDLAYLGWGNFLAGYSKRRAAALKRGQPFTERFNLMHFVYPDGRIDVLPTEEINHATHQTWSESGAYLYWCSRDMKAQKWGVYAYDLDTKTQRCVAPVRAMHATITRDDRYITFDWPHVPMGRGSGWETAFYNCDTKRQVFIHSSRPAIADIANKQYSNLHPDPHPQFVMDGKYIVSTFNTDAPRRMTVSITPVAPLIERTSAAR